MSDTPFDTGLQAERTLLAWRRTCLALGVVAATAGRLAASTLGGWTDLVGLAGVGVAALAYLAVAHRYRRVHHHLVERRGLPTGGATLAWVASAAALIALSSVVFLAARAA